MTGKPLLRFFAITATRLSPFLSIIYRHFILAPVWTLQRLRGLPRLCPSQTMIDKCLARSGS
jgi:hypothetical protein